MCTRSVNDSLINGVTDSLGKHFNNLSAECNIAVLKIAVSNRNKAAYLVAVNFNLVKGDVKLIERSNSLNPDALRNRASNNLTGIALNLFEVYMFDKL